MQKFEYDIVADPRIFRQNRLEAHSDHRFYRSLEELEKGNSSFRHSLNGDWYFTWAPNWEAADKDFFRQDVDCHAWKTIPVPAHIQMEGYGLPQYCNTQYPWDGKEEILPGEIPRIDNPVASYVSYFRLPEAWSPDESHPVYISFQGVESAIALWCNGSYVGYSEDSFTPSEFDLTPYLGAGENKLAAMVFRFSAGSWYEDQDFFRFSGIFREVFLYTVPRLHVRDLKLTDRLAEDFSEAGLSVDLKLQGSCPGGRVELLLTDGKSEVTGEIDPDELICGVQLTLQNPMLWSAEDPHLYRLRIRLLDSAGQVLELVEESVGFRRFECVDGIMCLNGKRIVFKGVNRHEFTSDKGRAISEEDILNDLLIMKRNNINAVRTSHYPNQSAFYRYCDRLGLYVIDETNLETHGFWESIMIGANDLSAAIPGDRPEAYAMMIDRARSMYERDKNHACILIWSCGNESLGGSVIYEMSRHFRRWDHTRLVHYEGVVHDSRYPETTDIYSTMYWPVDRIRETLKETNKPYISCEYAHAMGNSCGAMHKYTDLADTEMRYQGGFIWDFADQSITTRNRFGETYEAYGGDFGDRPCDYSFCGNGIVYGGAGHEISPKMQEVRYNYRNVKLEFCGGQVKIYNDNRFTDLSSYEIIATLRREGEMIRQMPLFLSLAPLSRMTIDLPIPIPQEEGEYVEEISFRLKEDRDWARAGYEMAYGEGVYGTWRGRGLRTGQGLRVVRGWMNTGVYGDDFSVLFSGRFGGMISYCYQGNMLFCDMPRPNFWRPMTENDLGNMQPFRSGQWKIASSYASMMKEHGRTADYYRVEELEDSVRVTYTYHLPTTPAKDCFLTYQVFADGSVACHLEMEETAEVGQLPEFGLLFTMDADYDQLRWYGRGPQETYIDRPHGKLDVFSNRVADNMASYLRPSECGNKIDVRWAECRNAEGHGVRFAMTNTAFNFSALPYSPDMIDCAQHAYELPRVDKTWIRIAKAQMGVGGDDSWGALVHPEYCIDNSKKLEFDFVFRGI